jgi:hypothetical protein
VPGTPSPGGGRLRRLNDGGAVERAGAAGVSLLSGAAVIGGEAELGEIDKLLDVTSAGARCLAFEGEAGIGKTTPGVSRSLRPACADLSRSSAGRPSPRRRCRSRGLATRSTTLQIHRLSRAAGLFEPGRPPSVLELRLGKSFVRPTLLKIEQACSGNPFRDSTLGDSLGRRPEDGQARSDVQFTSVGPLSDEGNERSSWSCRCLEPA